MTQHEYDVMLLLRDYNNFLPGGSGECYVPMTDGTHMGSSAPTTGEAARRFDSNTLTGATYQSVDAALNQLSRTHPTYFTALQRLYLEDDTGHRDVDFIREKSTSPYLLDIIRRHDEAIHELAKLIDPQDVYVRRPSTSVKPRSKDIGDINEALFVTYLRFREQGHKHRQALADTLVKFPEYTKKGAERIVSERLSDEAQRLYS